MNYEQLFDTTQHSAAASLFPMASDEEVSSDSTAAFEIRGPGGNGDDHDDPKAGRSVSLSSDANEIPAVETPSWEPRNDVTPNGGGGPGDDHDDPKAGRGLTSL